MKKIFFIYTTAFILNVFWENLHSVLYASYRGGVITELILVRASLFDALIITIILLPFLYFDVLKKNVWLMLVIAIVVAIINEWYGLGVGRWAYNSLMPILPIFHVGLTPAIQLAVLGYITFIVQMRFW